MDDKRFRRYLACGLFVFVGLCLVADWQGLFESTDAKTVFGILCDGFTFPGVLLTGVGGLKWISTTGFFDIWGYGGKTLLDHLHVHKTEFEHYYDYKQRRAAEREKKGWPSYILLSGGVTMGLAAICLIVYLIL